MCVGHSPPITATSVSFGEMHFAMMWFNLCLHLVPFDELFFFTWQDTSLRSHTHLLLFQSAQNVSGVCWQCEGYLTSVITMTALWLGPFTRPRTHTHTHNTYTHTTHTHTRTHNTHTHIVPTCKPIQVDGSVVLWDLREPEFMHKSPSTEYSSSVPRVATFTTGDEAL